MNIVVGSGKKRSVFVFPAAEIVNRSPVDQQIAGRNLLCDMLKISLEMPEMEAA
jgi:hypothetical protein